MEIADVDVPEDTHRAPRRSETNKAVLLLSFFVSSLVLGFLFCPLGRLHPLLFANEKAQEALRSAQFTRSRKALAFAIGCSACIRGRVLFLLILRSRDREIFRIHWRWWGLFCPGFLKSLQTLT